ncbi:hypothetical protein GGQ87_001303 [Brevundimonas alba]|uniref:ATP-binding protein n=1 Tax=Brevundimonas alba TaxID=74314 RepID=A0A7X6BNS6_9CAUL|nr:ATP-binding protein [Brevundimonas alba]NJC41045.1 hypothetical protein [Brevundimonas alba]
MTPRLSDIVSVARRFTRAVRVDADLTDPRALDGYVCSQSAIEALLLMARHHGATGHGAFTWTGPYGCGKSSLAIALAALAGGSRKAAEGLLAEVGDADRRELLGAFRGDKTPWLVVAAVGRRDDPERAIGEALAASVADLPGLERAKRESLAAWTLRVSADPRHAGLLLLVDEMGKFLEHAARADGDVHLFQDLAETASRSNQRLLLVGILHQAFDEYAHRLAREARDEWIKIQGRYLDIPINLAAEEQLDLIGRAIEAPPSTARSNPAAPVVAELLRSQRLGDAQTLEAKLHACWPLHPLVAALIGPVSRRRFGQNQRSLFGFLNSIEPYGFQTYLEEVPAKDAPLFPLARLWDYLHANLEPAILASPDGHRWSTALEAIVRAEGRAASADHLALLKAVALIDLFKDRSGLQATPQVLQHAVSGLAPKAVERILEELADWSVIIFRKHAGSYAIYAGSDFDIDAAVDRAREAGVALDYRQLARHAALQPVLAKRHYEITGALRWFEIEIAALADVEHRVRAYRPAPGAAGLFLLAISGEGESAAQAQTILKRASALAGEQLVVLGWTSDSFMIREMASDLSALEHVRAHSAELEGDAIARRELDARVARLSADLEDRLSDAVHGVKWVAPEGFDSGVSLRLSGPAGLSVVASRLADWRYPAAPWLPNELVNRSRPSSNAAAAVRALLRAMVGQASSPRLGIVGFPPQAGLYVSLLESTGLHRLDEATGTWRFVAPEAGDPHHLHALWRRTDELLAAAPDGLTMAEIFAHWRAAPFGVRDGLCTLLGAAYMMTRSGMTAVYLEGVYRPGLESFLIDRMVQDSSCVRIRSIVLTDVDVALISGLAERLSTTEATVPPTAFDVARGLITAVVNLPNWTLRTTRLTPTTIAFRDRAKVTDDPNQFLTRDVPKAFGLEADNYAGPVLARHVIAALDELKGAYSGMLAGLETILLRELRVKGDPDSLAKLRRRALDVKGLTGNFRLDALATRLSTFEGDIADMEGFAVLAANKPTRDWVDRDLDAASVELAALADQFLKAEIFQRLKGREGGRVAMAVYISDPDYPEPQSHEIQVSAAERETADALALRINDLLRAEGVSPDVALAAVASLGLILSTAPEAARDAATAKRTETAHG